MNDLVKELQSKLVNLTKDFNKYLGEYDLKIYGDGKSGFYDKISLDGFTETDGDYVLDGVICEITIKAIKDDYITITYNSHSNTSLFQFKSSINNEIYNFSKINTLDNLSLNYKYLPNDVKFEIDRVIYKKTGDNSYERDDGLGIKSYIKDLTNKHTISFKNLYLWSNDNNYKLPSDLTKLEITGYGDPVFINGTHKIESGAIGTNIPSLFTYKNKVKVYNKMKIIEECSLDNVLNTYKNNSHNSIYLISGSLTEIPNSTKLIGKFDNSKITRTFQKNLAIMIIVPFKSKDMNSLIHDRHKVENYFDLIISTLYNYNLSNNVSHFNFERCDINQSGNNFTYGLMIMSYKYNPVEYGELINESASLMKDTIIDYNVNKKNYKVKL